MKANSTAYRGNSVAMKAVNAGEVDGAVIYHYYYFGDQAKTGENSSNVRLHYFRNGDPGAFLSTSGAGVLAFEQAQGAGRGLREVDGGKHGQAVLRDGDSFEYAIGNVRIEPEAGADRAIAVRRRSSRPSSTARRSPN
jgi:iron(III) transport system substrate-binding protein